MTDFDQILSREIGVKEEDKKSKKSAKKKTVCAPMCQFM